MRRSSLLSILQSREDVAAEEWWPHSYLRKESSEGPTGTMMLTDDIGRLVSAGTSVWRGWKAFATDTLWPCHYVEVLFLLLVVKDCAQSYCQNICLLLLSEHFPLVCLINTSRQLTEMFHFKPRAPGPNIHVGQFQRRTVSQCRWMQLPVACECAEIQCGYAEMSSFTFVVPEYSSW